MKKKILFLFKIAALVLLLGFTCGFSQIPDSIWHTDDPGWFDMWNKTDLGTEYFWPHHSNWGVRNPGTNNATIYTDGNSFSNRPWVNLVWTWQPDANQRNFEIRFSWHMVSNPSGNSGFNIRGHCGAGSIGNQCGGAGQGYRVNGPQIDLGPTYTGDVWNSGSNRYATGSSVCKQNSTAWQDLGYRVSNDTLYTLFYRNGFDQDPFVCASYRLTSSNDVAASSPGLIALQYETTRENEFRNIQMRNLDATTPVGLGDSQQPWFLQTPRMNASGELEFSIREQGPYSLQIINVKGDMLQELEGVGPANQMLSLEKSGVYIVKMSSSKGTAQKKMFIQ